MMAYCDHEKMVVFSQTTNEWSQSQLNEKSTFMASTTTPTNLMEKPSHVQDLSHSQLHQNQQQPPPLKCPRCDSSNTKFCYYNNYSLSQPRHFCKACKRYWTRGGTLRNVPVGGGCRKNKRVKKAGSSGNNGVEGSTSASSSANTISPSNPQPQVEVISSALNHINNLFYGLPTNPCEMNLAFPSGISGGFEHHHDMLQPQLNSLGLGFSSSASSSSPLMSISTSTTRSDHPHNLVNGFTSNSLLSSYNSIFGSTSGTAGASPTMATFLASNFHQKRFQNGDATRGINQFQVLTSLEEFQLQMDTVSNGNGVPMKEVKVEGGGVGENRLDWSMNNPIDQIGAFTSDPSPLYWNTTSNNSSVGPWHDPTNFGSSVTSLI